MSTGLFGPCVNKLIPGRSKFNPAQHPNHAPKVPVEKADEYFELVKSRTPVRSGRLLRSLKLHKGPKWAWVSSDLIYGGIALEWGSCHQPRRLILSSSARKFTKDDTTPQMKAQRKRFTRQLRADANKRLRGGLREELRFTLTDHHASDLDTAIRVRDRLRGILREKLGPRKLDDPLPYHLLERIKRPFRSTLSTPATKPGKQLLARLRRIETMRDLRGLVERLTRAG